LREGAGGRGSWGVSPSWGVQIRDVLERDEDREQIRKKKRIGRTPKREIERGGASE